MRLGRFLGAARRGSAVPAWMLVLSATVGCMAPVSRVAAPVRAVEVQGRHARAVPATSPPAVPAPLPVTSVPEPLRPPEASATSTSVHVVRPGDTLWSIARSHGSTVAELSRLNRLDDPADIAVGQPLVLPGAPTGIWEWPVPGGWVLSTFGAPRRTHRHQGVDIGGRRGQPVLAVHDGKVIYSDDGMRGYGKTIILDHGEGITTLYAHNSSLLVRKGQHVRRGDPVARVGRSGNASGEHCHFEIRRDDVPLDPMAFLARPGGTP